MRNEHNPDAEGQAWRMSEANTPIRGGWKGEGPSCMENTSRDIGKAEFEDRTRELCFI